MKKDIADKWVAALRSGKYKQGTGYLEKDGRFCCLGVLCDIMGVPKVLERRGFYQYDGNGGGLSPAVAEMAGSVNIRVFTPNAGVPHLVQMNDSGVPFDKIADVIEQNWEAL